MRAHVDDALLAALRDRIDRALRPYVHAAPAFALLEFPDHTNIGDSAIWLGEMAYFDAIGKRPSYVCSKPDFRVDELERAVPEGPIFLHGGGSFGDVWPASQVFRQRILERYRGRLIVQLPQSIHFANSRALERAAAAVERHGNFVLFVRDVRSFAIARGAFRCRVELVPDMALCLGPFGPHPARHDLLVLLRSDHERRDDAASPTRQVPADAVVRDWMVAEHGMRYRVRAQNALESLLRGPWGSDGRQIRRERYYRKLAQRRLARGLTMLSSAHFVISDRLHVHLLCTLLGVPHALFDQSYGKIQSFMETWTQPVTYARLYASLDQALTAVP